MNWMTIPPEYLHITHPDIGINMHTVDGVLKELVFVNKLDGSALLIAAEGNSLRLCLPAQAVTLETPAPAAEQPAPAETDPAVPEVTAGDVQSEVVTVPNPPVMTDEEAAIAQVQEQAAVLPQFNADVQPDETVTDPSGLDLSHTQGG